MSISPLNRTATIYHEDERIKPGDRIFRSPIAAERGPVFTPVDAAKFFATSGQMLRLWERQGVFDLEREVGERRKYTLADIENISYALADHGKVSYDEHRAILNIVLNFAKIWGIA